MAAVYPKTAAQKSAVRTAANVPPFTDRLRHISFLELDSQPYLAFASGQELQRFAERRRQFLKLLHGGWACPIKQIKELNQSLKLYLLVKGEPSRKTRVEIDIGWRLEVIAPGLKVHTVPQAVTIHIGGYQSSVAEMKSALCVKDATSFKAPGELHQPIKQQRVVQRQVGRAAVEVRSIVGFSRLGNGIAVTGYELAFWHWFVQLLDR